MKIKPKFLQSSTSQKWPTTPVIPWWSLPPRFTGNQYIHERESKTQICWLFHLNLSAWLFRNWNNVRCELIKIYIYMLPPAWAMPGPPVAPTALSLSGDHSSDCGFNCAGNNRVGGSWRGGSWFFFFFFAYFYVLVFICQVSPPKIIHLWLFKII